MKVGISVQCKICGQDKAPHGRSVPMATWNSWCTDDRCKGYNDDPKPGCLWPSETEADFGFKICAHATKEVPDEEFADETV